MLPIHVGSISERSDFEKLDIDMSGTISIDEFITGGFSLGDSFEEIDRVGYIRTAFSELACLKNQESFKFPPFKIGVKKIGLPKNPSSESCVVSEC